MKPNSETVLELERSDTEYRGDARIPVRPGDSIAEAMRAKTLSHSLVNGVIVGRLVGFTESSVPLVDFPGNKSGISLAARSTVGLNDNHAGSDVALVFDEGELTKPIILGCIQPPFGDARAAPIEVKLDGRQIVLTAEQELVLRCGKASITLTRAGKVLIRGAYLLSRSSGVNRIKGGSVQIN